MEIAKVGVIGAGVMGSDVALALACKDLDVILTDVDDSALERSGKRIERDFRMVKMVLKETREKSLALILKRIRFTTDLEENRDVDLVIECVTENWDVKRGLYARLAGICGVETYYATNTSCISVTRIASLLPNPDRVIGMHFMNPVPMKKLVETIRGYHTSTRTVEVLTSFLRSIGKDSVVVKDYTGFVANRLSHLFMNEAAFLVQDGVAEPKQIDKIFKHGYGHRMGPLETADLIGLDTVVQSLNVLYQSYQDSKFRCCPYLRKMVDAGLLGRKSGKGFYEYGDAAE